MAPSTLVDQRWLLVSSKGEGTFGSVWLALDTRFENRPVAVKLLKPEFTMISEVVRRFENEAIALAHLRHVNIVQVLDRGAWQGTNYIVMEYVEGQTLADLLRSYGARGERPPLDLVLRLFDQICAGVAAAHRAMPSGPIVHRDLKPENVMLLRDQDDALVVKVVDFGIAQLGGRSSTRSGVQMGTLHYMAPEQLLGEARRVCPATDVFALGVILLEMLTLQSGFDEQTSWAAYAVRNEAAMLGEVRGRRSDVPQAVLDVLGRALRADPEQRPSTAEVLRAAVRPLLMTGSTSNAPPAPQAWRASHPSVGRVADGSTHATTHDRFVRLSSSSLRVEEAQEGRVGRGVMILMALMPISAMCFGYVVRRQREDEIVEWTSTPPRHDVVQRPTSGGNANARPREAAAVPVTAISAEVCPPAMVEISEGDRGAFCISNNEVTVSEFSAYARSAGLVIQRTVNWRGINELQRSASSRYCTIRGARVDSRDPINCVDWNAARSYCQTLAQGGDLPTAAQWERALHDGRAHADGGAGRFPWGDDEPSAGMMNGCGEECIELVRRLDDDSRLDPLFVGGDGFRTVSPVGQFEADCTHDGRVCDLVGNLSEWTVDAYVVNADGGAPSRCATGECYWVRGASWRSAGGQFNLESYRQNELRDIDLGFRCAAPVRSN